MKKLAFALLAAVSAGSAMAQTVYAPTRSVATQEITLRGWGSGLISETDEVANEGAFSLRISTRNYFQGGIMMFAKPVDLSGAFGNKNNLLNFLVRAPESATGNTIRLGGGGGPGNTGGGGGRTDGDGGPAGGGGAMGGGAMGGGAMGGGAMGGGGGGGTTTQVTNKLRNLRVIVSTTDGKKSEAYLAVPAGAATDWRGVSIPLPSIKGFDKTNRMVSSIAISGDATAVFYVSEVKVVEDTTPITGSLSPRDDMNLALGDEVTFTANGFGGASTLKYLWDFDGDGQTDAEGQVVKRKFRKAGEFVVKVTITDANGIKASRSETVKVKVNP